ncbi:hypothetical protein S2091_3916 [Solimicrobium silvestre]|uniref:Uncharacterized protein n=1 Tax=Solimicrobium silvestre TaxID=2099400 RepID=A0A2S9GUJ3_9BURK|nr:hypothetical protein S2091_3916 [Solimicrobium silvestre]
MCYPCLDTPVTYVPRLNTSPKKVTQKRRPHYFGNPDFSQEKWEKFETRLRLRQRTFLIHFPCEKPAELEVGASQKQLQNQIQKQLQHQHQHTQTTTSAVQELRPPPTIQQT